jgi:hypothetical protein
MIDTNYIRNTIIDAVYQKSGSATCFNTEMRPILERYNLLSAAGFQTPVIMIVDELLSCAKTERILPGGKYPNGAPKSQADVFTDFCKALGTKINDNSHIFKTTNPEMSMK